MIMLLREYSATLDWLNEDSFWTFPLYVMKLSIYDMKVLNCFTLDLKSVILIYTGRDGYNNHRWDIVMENLTTCKLKV
ncbi:uncharacterized protein Smp_204290 [Schistosoma mansoni]|uniref:Ovule protein n=1 Tax=Schistosoma mansoni TaxID=6183 RepID=G4VT82_SCHMA|nr:uncharacterized protein Smp_204290 [Schistosoma mansoni]|eukprot:XP_018655595.1 uncharacterized protein Smp_204290 [Schistosoma mansoni]